MPDSDFSPSLDREEPGTGEFLTSKKAKLPYGVILSSAKISKNQKKNHGLSTDSPRKPCPPWHGGAY